MQKFKKSGIILLSAVLCASALSACLTTDDEEYTPKRQVQLTGNSYVSRSPYEDPETVDSACYNEEHAYYVFSSDVSPKERDEIMDCAEEILERFGYFEIRFYTLENCITGYVDAETVGDGYYTTPENEMFLKHDEFSPVYITLACNQKKYGTDVSYGLMYALSYGQCKDWGYELPERLCDEEIATCIAKTPEIAALNTAVFQTYFTSAEEKAAAEGLAIKLYEKLGLSGLEKLALSDNSNSATKIYVDGLCYSLGAAPLVYDPLSGYKMYNTAWYVVAESENVRIFMSKVFYDLCYPYFKNLADYFLLLQAVPRQIEELKDYMGITKSPRLEILYDGYFFAGPGWEGTSYAGMTYPGWIQSASVYSTVHEFTHLLTWYFTDGYYINESSFNGWTGEAFPSYTSALFDENFFAAGYYVWDSEYGVESVTAELLTLLREMLVLHPVTNAVEYFDLYAYCMEETGRGGFSGWGSADNLKLPHAIAISFVNYMIETYGKDKFMNLYYTHGATEKRVYGKDFYTLYTEWQQSIKAKFES